MSNLGNLGYSANFLMFRVEPCRLRYSAVLATFGRFKLFLRGHEIDLVAPFAMVLVVNRWIFRFVEFVLIRSQP